MNTFIYSTWVNFVISKNRIMDLKNKIIIVVGASSGIGLSTARHLHKKGACIIMVARNQARLNDAAKKVNKDRTRLSLVSADMTTQQGRTKILNSAPTIDHLIITAADLAYMPFKNFTEEAAVKIINSKLLAPFFLTQIVVGKLTSKSSITFTSGIAAEKPMRGGALTGAVNAALNSLVKGLALELAPVRVNAVSPGWTETPVWENVIPNQVKRREIIETMSKKIPLGRIGKAEDIAMAMEAIITNDFINASVLDINGGQLLV